MDISAALSRERGAILSSWLARALEVYPADAAQKFGTSRDPFQNPVGQAHRQGLRAVIDALIAGAGPEALCAGLEPILKVRAVQELAPSDALAFVFALRDVLGEVLKPAPEVEPSITRQIDQLALFAFDIYSQARQRILEIRIGEVRRQVSSMMRRSGMFSEPEGAQAPPAADSPNRGADP